MLFHSYIAGELQEEGQEKYNNFIDELNHRIVGVSTNGDDKKGIILAIGEIFQSFTSCSYFIGTGPIFCMKGEP